MGWGGADEAGDGCPQGMPRFGTRGEGARVIVMEFVVSLAPHDRGLELKLNRSKEMGTELSLWVCRQAS